MAAISSKTGVLSAGCSIVKMPKVNNKSDTGNIAKPQITYNLPRRAKKQPVNNGYECCFYLVLLVYIYSVFYTY
jgi:hypothetical protein